jgi:hypothetical protein
VTAGGPSRRATIADLRAVPGAEIGRAEAVVAWRFWDVIETSQLVLLQSPFRSVVWPPAEPLHAECLGLRLPSRARLRHHDAPGPGCRCGVYGAGYRDLRTFLDSNLMRPASVPVLGRVLLWGRVVADQFGFRASRAYPEQLLVSTLTTHAVGIARSLERDYGVGVTLLDTPATFRALRPKAAVPIAE